MSTPIGGWVSVPCPHCGHRSGFAIMQAARDPEYLKLKCAECGEDVTYIRLAVAI